MSGSISGNNFKISTWGESHGKAIGVVIDGCPAGLPLCENDIQMCLDRRKPGQNKYTTQRKESDKVSIMSGIFEGVTTGTPISLMVINHDPHSGDYTNIKDVYRPGHADYTYDAKYGIRDYRGGGRSSGRETIGRVAAGAVAAKLLKELGIEILTYTKSIGPIVVNENDYIFDEITSNALYMPGNEKANEASKYLENCIKNQDSSGGCIECIITGMPVGIGEPVFDKLDANLAKAIMSIGAVKSVEFGLGSDAGPAKGSENNDSFIVSNNKINKKTNNSGGILGGLSDGSPIIMRAVVKPTPSISRRQGTVNTQHEEVDIEIKGRHDPVIVPRAVVVVESMAAVTILDLLMSGASSRVEYLKRIFL